MTSRTRNVVGLVIAAALAGTAAPSAHAQATAYVTVQTPAVPVPAAPVVPQLPAAVPVAPQGQWVNTAEYGLIWIPAGSTTYVLGGVPYAYLYTPAYGWTWYASPWGTGAYTYGAWISRPAPFGVRVWVNGPSGWAWHVGPHARARFFAAAPRHHVHTHYGYARGYAPPPARVYVQAHHGHMHARGYAAPRVHVQPRVHVAPHRVAPRVHVAPQRGSMRGHGSFGHGGHGGRGGRGGHRHR